MKLLTIVLLTWIIPLGGKINVVEREDGFLTFSNLGHFIPESVESVITADAPEEQYRKPFLANAMVNLNLIDTIGSGIKKMFVIQKNKFFPLPEYNLENNNVTVTIIGKVLDIKYAQKIGINARSKHRMKLSFLIKFRKANR